MKITDRFKRWAGMHTTEVATLLPLALAIAIVISFVGLAILL